MQRTTAQSLVYYQFHNLLPHTNLAHGVFTRQGGYSTPPWNSLNTGYSVGDDLAAVEANHQLIYHTLGFKDEDHVSPNQVHGAAVCIVNERTTAHPEVDALVTEQPGILLMLRYADCTPVVFYDPVQRVAALAHAGWRGTVAGIVRETVKTMQECGCRPADICAGIGAAIGPCCYEVGAEVAEAVTKAFPDSPHLLIPKANGRWHFDLWAANAHQLRQSGVQQVEVAEICTACRTDEWFSYRAENKKTGHHCALIGMREQQRANRKSQIANCR